MLLDIADGMLGPLFHMFICSKEICLYVQKRCVCMFKRDMFVCSKEICLYVQKRYVCIFKRDIFVCSKEICLCVQKRYVCMSKRDPSKTLDTLHQTYIQKRDLYAPQKETYIHHKKRPIYTIKRQGFFSIRVCIQCTTKRVCIEKRRCIEYTHVLKRDVCIHTYCMYT